MFADCDEQKNTNILKQNGFSIQASQCTSIKTIDKFRNTDVWLSFYLVENTKKLKIATTNIVFYDEYLLTNFLSNKVARLVNTAIAINVSKSSHIFDFIRPVLTETKLNPKYSIL